MLIRVHALGITPGRSRLPLRTDKKRKPLARWSRRLRPGLAKTTSLQCDARSPPAGEAVESGYLIN